MRKMLVVATTTAVVGVLAGLGAPASAAPGDTGATFTLSAGSTLAVSVPSSTVNLGSATAGATSLTGSLGAVTVTDTRGLLAAAWTATVSSTNFTTGTATANETVSNALISYSSGSATAAAGQVGAMTPSTGLTLAAPAVAGVWAGVGNNTVTWTPSLTFTLLASQVAGTYAGTITHSVA